ncbi:MAG: hypothetical protein OCC49_08270 [Fibrobacterales bacterium]
MFVIRDEQMHKIMQPTVQKFLVRLAVHVRKVFPDAVASLDDTELEEQLYAYVRTAQRNGFSTEGNITLFVDLYYGLDTKFLSKTKYQYICEPLLDSAMSEDSRIYLTYKRIK